MKKLISCLFILILVVIGCDKIPSEVVGVDVNSIKVGMLQAPANFSYTSTNTSFVTSVKLETEGEIKSVTANLRSGDGKYLYYKDIALLDDGKTGQSGDQVANDNYYSAIIKMNEGILSGTLIIEYYVTYSIGKQVISQKFAVHQFAYDNGSSNVAPEIYNLSAPDTIIVEPPKSIFSMSISARDENGLNDILEVYFITYKPDGTTNNNKAYLLDNGNPYNGDLVASDGIFSIIVEITPNNLKGDYVFEFKAKDRRGKFSNVINHKITVK
jgi:hypothetical protein